MKTIYASGDQVMALGRQGEDRAVRVLFDLSGLKKEHGEGAAVLTLCRAGEGERWLLLPEREEDMAVWVVSGHWTRFAGYGSCQLSWYVDGALAKSVSYPTRVEPALDTGGADIDPDLDFLAQVQRAAGQAALAAQKAQNVELGLVHQPTVVDGTWWVWDQEAEGYRDTGEQARGPAGVSPLVEVDVSGQDLGITVTDAAGTKNYSFQAATTAQLQALDAAKAPAGYGLGGSAAACPNDDCDQALYSGWYTVTSSTANGPGWAGVVRVDRRNANCIYQTAYSYGQNRAVKTRAMQGGSVFLEWEWVNPPMELGVEYRTTERWGGKTVYVKRIDLGAMPNTTNKAVVYYGTGSTSVRYEAYLVTASGNVSPIPYHTSSGLFAISVFASKYAVTVIAQADHSAHTGFAVVRYTKD